MFARRPNTGSRRSGCWTTWGRLGETDADLVAAAILELLDAPPSVPPTLPSWDDCAGAVLELYEDLLTPLPAPGR